MTIVLALAVGFLAARVLLMTLRGVLAAEVLDRENYRGHHLPTAAGFLVVLAVIVGLLAAITPARRAAKLNPLEALHYE